MSEQALKPDASVQPRAWMTWALIVAVVVIFVVSILVVPTGTEFAGTDAIVTETLEADGEEPWLAPLFEPTGEVESGLFALQAALGAGVLGYVLGRLHGLSKQRR